ncbi:unnamed protein product, partial [Polarella glacialis]
MALEHLGLWLLYPREYRVVVAWFDREFGQLERVLSHGVSMVRTALGSCRMFSVLAAGYDVRCRVKSPQSLMKKLLEGREVKDLLGMELVIDPASSASLSGGFGIVALHTS